MNYELYLVSSSSSECDWALALVHPASHACTHYTSMGGPSTSPPSFYRAVRQRCNDCLGPSCKDRRQVGYIPSGKLAAFEKVYRSTVAGPRQFFATRIVYACVSRGILLNPVLEGLISDANYTDAELEYFGGKYCLADEEFLEQDTLAVKVTAIPPSLEAL
ncbi:uncharacterized protein BDV14DRAFT_198509 [Aspergillus stella-maris]|uniref:uncharacterized protein n=1 Tax=Aspergillus stella-maris TaxID=1810926 RepID=UPI003CCC97CB